MIPMADDLPLRILYTLQAKECQEAIFVLKEKQLFMLQIRRSHLVIWLAVI